MVINKHAMRVSNELSVIRHVINYGPISRSKISRDLSINKVTISSILEDLLKQKYVIEIGEGKSTKVGGRKPLLITFNGFFGYFINLEVSKRFINIMATYANGQINRFEEIAISSYSEEEIKNLILKKINSFKVKDTVKGLLGISVSLHTQVYKNTPKDRLFKTFDLKALLEKEFNVPTILFNNANAAAIFQRDFSSDNDIKNLISITIDENINAGIIIDENLYLGNLGLAGNIEDMLFFLNKDESTKLIQQCTQEAILHELSKNEGLTNLNIQQVAKLYVKGNEEVASTLNNFVDNISLILNNLIACYSPQVIILDSALLENIPLLLIQIKNKLPILNKTKTKLEIARQSRFAPLLGGYSILMRQVFNLGEKRLHLVP